jgi:hypothetical protein
MFKLFVVLVEVRVRRPAHVELPLVLVAPREEDPDASGVRIPED